MSADMKNETHENISEGFNRDMKQQQMSDYDNLKQQRTDDMANKESGFMNRVLKGLSHVEPTKQHGFFEPNREATERVDETSQQNQQLFSDEKKDRPFEDKDAPAEQKDESSSRVGWFSPRKDAAADNKDDSKSQGGGWFSSNKDTPTENKDETSQRVGWFSPSKDDSKPQEGGFFDSNKDSSFDRKDQTQQGPAEGWGNIFTDLWDRIKTDSSNIGSYIADSTHQVSEYFRNNKNGGDDDDWYNNVKEKTAQNLRTTREKIREAKDSSSEKSAEYWNQIEGKMSEMEDGTLNIVDDWIKAKKEAKHAAKMNITKD